MFRPKLDLTENKDEYKISMEIPRVEKNVQIQLQEDRLIVRGEKKQEAEQKDENYHRKEYSHGYFDRLLSVPKDANTDKIEAKFDGGLLNIMIEKNPEAKPEGRKIDIQKK